MKGVRIAIVGAESTGKTSLAQALRERLACDSGLRCEWVAEWLREWCESRGRTPRPEEQAGIAAEQARRVEVAAARADIVIADTTPLMTAVYSDLLFQDRSLYEAALAHQRDYSFTLLTALDLPWEADGLQRDGPQVRPPVDRLVRDALLKAGVPWSVVSGTGPSRLEHALDALTPLLAPKAPGLFTRLQQREAAQPAWQWVCESCDDPQCEHALLRASR